MANTVIFRGAYIRKVELLNKDDGRHVRIEFTSDWTDVVREHMDWEDVAECVGLCDLVGRLAASNLQLVPSKRELKPLGLEMAVDEVSGFNLVPLKDGKGESTGRELRFTVKSTATDAAKNLEQYVHTVGRGLARLEVSYVKQENLPLEEKKEALAGV